jgi:hypothetical protein
MVLRTTWTKVSPQIIPLTARCQRLMLVNLTNWEAEIKKIVVQSQPRPIVCKILSQKYPTQKQGWWSGSSGRACA